MWEGWPALADQRDLEYRVCGAVAEPLPSRQESQSSIPKSQQNKNWKMPILPPPSYYASFSLRKPGNAHKPHTQRLVTTRAPNSHRDNDSDVLLTYQSHLPGPFSCFHQML